MQSPRNNGIVILKEEQGVSTKVAKFYVALAESFEEKRHTLPAVFEMKREILAALGRNPQAASAVYNIDRMFFQTSSSTRVNCSPMQRIGRIADPSSQEMVLEYLMRAGVDPTLPFHGYIRSADMSAEENQKLLSLLESLGHRLVTFLENSCDPVANVGVYEIRNRDGNLCSVAAQPVDFTGNAELQVLEHWRVDYEPKDHELALKPVHHPDSVPTAGVLFKIHALLVGHSELFSWKGEPMQEKASYERLLSQLLSDLPAVAYTMMIRYMPLEELLWQKFEELHNLMQGSSAEASEGVTSPVAGPKVESFFSNHPKWPFFYVNPENERIPLEAEELRRASIWEESTKRGTDLTNVRKKHLILPLDFRSIAARHVLKQERDAREVTVQDLEGIVQRHYDLLLVFSPEDPKRVWQWYRRPEKVPLYVRDSDDQLVPNEQLMELLPYLATDQDRQRVAEAYGMELLEPEPINQSASLNLTDGFPYLYEQ
jgi:hypothetical protein